MAFKPSVVADYIGRGVTLPLTLVNGAPPLDTGVKLIRASIKMILTWVFGTRPFLTEFGSRIEELIEEPNDQVLKNVADTLIREALEIWEPRIDLLNTTISKTDLGKFTIEITYEIITSKQTDSFVFPFYSEITS